MGWGRGGEMESFEMDVLVPMEDCMAMKCSNIFFFLHRQSHFLVSHLE